MPAAAKRKSDVLTPGDRSGKKPKLTPHPSGGDPGSSSQEVGDEDAAISIVTLEDAISEDAPMASVEGEKKKGKRKVSHSAQDESDASKVQYRKLAPPRPFPTVPTSVNATGPRSAHVEGKNYICITRKTPLGAYLRRCKDVVLKAGHKTLHLHAMGAAIPHLLQLSLSLPEVLPYAADEIRTEILTGTVEVQDEVIPDDEDEDTSLRTRGKSTLSIVITIGDGKDEGAHTGKGRSKPRNASSINSRRPKGKAHVASESKAKQGGGGSVGQHVYTASDVDM